LNNSFDLVGKEKLTHLPALSSYRRLAEIN
jgi:hypothetical protein